MFLYNFLIYSTRPLLYIASVFNGKLRCVIKGRKRVFQELKDWQLASKQVIWVHAASFGEYQLLVPILDAIKRKDKNYTVLLSFFSSSGYEACKCNPYTPYVCYLPLDTPMAAKRFLDLVNPQKVLIAKNEFWPNYLYNIGRRGIPCFLVSGRFRKGQALTRPWGEVIRNSLKNFTRIFVIDGSSKEVVDSLNLGNVVLVTGDTGFDSVFARSKEKINMDFIDRFLDGVLCIVAGSTYPKEDEMFLEHLKDLSNKVKYIIVPHDINPEYIDQLHNKCPAKTILFSEIKYEELLSDYQVLILDTVGLLSQVYKYANIAYVGGGFRKRGLHNVLEPAVFGCPIFIGPEYSKFTEATDLVNLGGILPISDAKTFINKMDNFLNSQKHIRHIGAINLSYVENHQGATEEVLKNINL